MLVWRPLALFSAPSHVSEWMQRRVCSVRIALVVQRAGELAALCKESGLWLWPAWMVKFREGVHGGLV